MAAYIQAVLCLSHRSSWRYMVGQAGWAHILSLSGKHDSGTRDRRLVPNINLCLALLIIPYLSHRFPRREIHLLTTNTYIVPIIIKSHAINLKKCKKSNLWFFNCTHIHKYTQNKHETEMCLYICTHIYVHKTYHLHIYIHTHIHIHQKDHLQHVKISDADFSPLNDSIW